MWLLSMNQRHCGSALPYFLLCFLEHPGVAQPQQAQRGWRLGPHPSSCPTPVKGTKGGQPWVVEIALQKEGFQEEHEVRPPSGRSWWGKLAGKGAGALQCPTRLWLLGLSTGSCCRPMSILLPTQLAHRRGTALLPHTSCPPTSPHHYPHVHKSHEHHCKREGRQSQNPSKSRSSPKNRGDKAWVKIVGSGTSR